jgi:polyisoprenoid-binding protein YceI
MDKFECQLSRNTCANIASRPGKANKQSRIGRQIRDALAFVMFLMAFFASPRASYAQVPTYEVTPDESSIKFGVESSVPIKGTFEKWDASIKFSSRDVRSAALDIQIEAGSVNTGSHMKDNRLKGKDFL